MPADFDIEEKKIFGFSGDFATKFGTASYAVVAAFSNQQNTNRTLVAISYFITKEDYEAGKEAIMIEKKNLTTTKLISNSIYLALKAIAADTFTDAEYDREE